MHNLPQQGRVEWLGVRPEKKVPLHAVDTVKVLAKGLQGDHYAGRSGNRSVTLIQAEHIQTIRLYYIKIELILPNSAET